MTQARPPMDWNERYVTGELPWDSGEVDENLLEVLRQIPSGGRALEIGCGTGTNAIALAQHGFSHVTATDLSPKAIEMARAKAKVAPGSPGSATTIDFKVHDIIAAAPVPNTSVDFVFDRGVFHSVSEDQRPTFARRVADALTPKGSGEAGNSGGSGGWWLTLCGNADDKTELGPPRLTAAHIASVVEPLFEIHTLSRSWFRKVKGASDTFLCWRVLLRKR